MKHIAVFLMMLALTVSLSGCGAESQIGPVAETPDRSEVPTEAQNVPVPESPAEIEQEPEVTDQPEETPPTTSTESETTPAPVKPMEQELPEHSERPTTTDEPTTPEVPEISEAPETPPSSGTEPTIPTPPEGPVQDENMEENTEVKLNVQVGGQSFLASFEENAAVDAFIEMMEQAPVVIEMRDYSCFEKVGSLGQSLPTSDSQTTTQAGDIVLYNGNQIVIFYGSNSWSYTRLGKIDDLTGWEDALGSGDVTVTFSIGD